MSLGTFAFGPYTATYTPSTNASGSGLGSTDLGLVEGVRILEMTPAGKYLQSDYYGPGTDVEGIHQGGNCAISMTFKEWAAIHKAVIWPFGTMGQVGQVGRQHTDLAGALVLTAVSNTLAYTNGFKTITANLALITANQATSVTLGTDARDVPVTFKLFPYMSSGNLVWFTTTG